ncbi:VOC family protein [Thalassoroseus pseudoceratinae]|uniref:VOC family protein n=1 Tax=Thalassoroseus pseudoceratinae TaxID=2713176 RepID=UPI0014213E62|nr:VOC family protein [Thalassoroseus pseudoceratinae]
MAKPRTVECRGLCVCLSCTDRWRSEEFYIDVLGFRLVRGGEEPGVCRWYQLGDITISIMPNASRPMPAGFYPEQSTFLLWLETDDLQALHERCVNAGVPIEFYDEETVLEISDPDGLPIEINQKFDD